MAKKTAIEPTRAQNYAQWYQEVVKAAELAENTPARGCMVIRPWGYRIWEEIKSGMDMLFKQTGVENAYFPLFIPLSFLQKEAAHVEGFAKECAIVTHHRLEANEKGELHPAGPLEEPLVVRPTSETMVGELFARWIDSHRDLPLLINQWANVVRWEMRTRLFLRTAEILWQEGHTAHATREEAEERTRQMLDVYARFGKEWLAIPFIKGIKSESERFPGAVETYTIEGMMQDRKALQAGTSHFLGQNFSKASEIKFNNVDGELEYAWTTSWGATTRLIGALVMVHSDDDGMMIPPRVAPSHLVILPFLQKEEHADAVLAKCEEIQQRASKMRYHGRPIEVIIDKRDMRGGEKMWSWVKKGAPLRLEVGPRDMENDCYALARRDRSPKEKETFTLDGLIEALPEQLEQMQQAMYDRALAFRNENMVKIDTKEELYDFFKGEKVGGFALCHWNGNAEVEAKIKEDLGVTIRCIPLDSEKENGACIITGEPSEQRVIFAKAY